MKFAKTFKNDGSAQDISEQFKQLKKEYSEGTHKAGSYKAGADVFAPKFRTKLHCEGPPEASTWSLLSHRYMGTSSGPYLSISDVCRPPGPTQGGF